jgi:hypothetical protein
MSSPNQMHAKGKARDRDLIKKPAIKRDHDFGGKAIGHKMR